MFCFIDSILQENTRTNKNQQPTWGNSWWSRRRVNAIWYWCGYRLITYGTPIVTTQTAMKRIRNIVQKSVRISNTERSERGGRVPSNENSMLCVYVRPPTRRWIVNRWTPDMYSEGSHGHTRSLSATVLTSPSMWSSISISAFFMAVEWNTNTRTCVEFQLFVNAVLPGTMYLCKEGSFDNT